MRMVIVGCGPKAIAIYAKAKALEAAGWQVPEICILEQNEVAANWCGEYGFTNGKQPLGTPPEKDIGYPYASKYKDPRGKPIDEYVLPYSWQSYKVSKGEYADWLDRGRSAPPHVEWADYLRWVAGKVGLEQKLYKGAIQQVSRENNKWMLRYSGEDTLKELECDALVFTGPGVPKRLPGQANTAGGSKDYVGDTVMDGENFWRSINLNHIRNTAQSRPTLKIAVIGAGETAASVVSTLVNIVPETCNIDVISRRGTLFSRGEGYHENRYFSDPTDNWQKFSLDLRQEVIERTDRGVLSLKAVDQITRAKNVFFRHGEVTRIMSPTPGKAKVYLLQQTESGPSVLPPEDYAFVIVALGFDVLSFVRYFEAGILDHPFIDAESTDRELKRNAFNRCARTIEKDLSVSGIGPKLYLPMLAGLMQGPGFPNLSCLGRLSDRVLEHSFELLNDRGGVHS